MRGNRAILRVNTRYSAGVTSFIVTLCFQGSDKELMRHDFFVHFRTLVRPAMSFDRELATMTLAVTFVRQTHVLIDQSLRARESNTSLFDSIV